MLAEGKRMPHARLYAAVAVPMVRAGVPWPVSIRYGLAASGAATRAVGLCLSGMALTGIGWIVHLAIREPPSSQPGPPRADFREVYRHGFMSAPRRRHSNPIGGIVALPHKLEMRNPAPVESGILCGDCVEIWSV